MRKTAIAFGFFAFFTGIVLSSALAADSLKIGVLLPLTGRNAAIGQIQKNAVQMATAEINARGGVKDRKIELFLADTQGNPGAGRAAIGKLIKQDKVLVISGGFSSSATWTTSSIAQQNRMPFVVTSAAADRITEQGWDYIFRLNQPLSEHLKALASFLSTVATKIKSVAIVHENSLGGSAAARRFFRSADRLGLEPVIRERFEDGANDLSVLLTRVKVKNPDLIYAVAEDAISAALLVRQSKALKLNPKLFVGEGDGFVRPGFATQPGLASSYIVRTALWTPQLPFPGTGAFNQKFKDQHKTPPGHFGAEAHAGIDVIADALKRSRVLTSAAIRNALAQTNMTTLLGPIKFVAYNQKSQQNKLPTYLVQWMNAKPEIIWPKKFATHKPVYPAP